MPPRVSIEKSAAGFRLLRDGEPYFIKGAVGGVRLDQLAAAGGNSTRTVPDRLDEAHVYGLTALAGLPLGIQRSGFDYSNQGSLQQQRNRIRDIVRKWRDHPALLIWNLGNEPEIHTSKEQRRDLWAEVNRLAELVRENDPNHPVISVIGDAYRRILHEIRDACPALDAIGLNAYKDMLTMPEDVAREGWNKPYLVTEFGPVGHWQVPKTAWGIPIEDTSTQKAVFYEKAYRHAVLDRPNCLGAYVFHWNQHMEKTHTWYGMFLADGSRMEPIDVMTRLWTGREPANRCPRVSPITTAQEGDLFRARIDASDADNDSLDITWDLRPDVADNPNVGGDREDPVLPIPGAILRTEGPTSEFRLPAPDGNYRLFVYVRDGHGNAATANLPLRRAPLANP